MGWWYVQYFILLETTQEAACRPLSTYILQIHHLLYRTSSHGCDSIEIQDTRISQLFSLEQNKGWSGNGGAKWFIFETTAKQNKFMQEKILKFTSKIEQIKDTIMGNVSVTSILINSNNIYSGKMREIVKSFNGHLKVDYLLSAELRDENNGNYHILGGRKLEDHVCKQIIEFVKKQALEYLLGQRIFGPNGEIDIILITNDTSASLEEKLLQHLIYCDNYNLYTGKKHR